MFSWEVKLRKLVTIRSSTVYQMSDSSGVIITRVPPWQVSQAWDSQLQLHSFSGAQQTPVPLSGTYYHHHSGHLFFPLPINSNP